MSDTYLVVGGSHSDVPVILAAKEMGFKVATSGNRPTDIGHRYSDEYHPIDYSVPEDVLRLARSVNASAVSAGANDFAALSAAYVAEELGLPGHDSPAVARLVHHKDEFRAFSLANGFPVPRAFPARSLQEVEFALAEIGTPAMVKPVDMTGGKGISLVSSHPEWEPAARKALETSRNGRVVVEEFVSGSRHGCTSIIVAGQVRFFFVDDEHYLLNPFLVAAASTPSSVPDEHVATVRNVIERYATLLDLVDGVFHMQFVLTQAGPVVIEVCRRPPGDLYPWLVDLATGAPYSTWVAAGPTGELPGVFEAEPASCVLRLCVMSDQAGTVLGIDRQPGDAELVKDMMWWSEGDVITDPLTQKLGIVFLRYETAEALTMALSGLSSVFRPIMTQGGGSNGR